MSHSEENAPETGTDGALREKKEMNIEEMREEVHRLSKDLGISLEEAERSLYGSYGMDIPADRINVSDLSELKEGMRGVTLKARVVTVHLGTRKDGEGDYHYGLLGDSKGTIKFSAWSEFDYSPGDALIIQNASVREFRDDLEVVLNDRCIISSIDDTDGLIPPVEETVPGMIAELSPKVKRIDVEGRFIELTRMDVRTQEGGTKEIQRGMLADRSGRISVTCWDVLPLEEGSCYRIVGGYVKEYNGRFRLNLDSGVIIKGLHDDRLPSMEDLSAPGDARIIDLTHGRISGQIRLRGTVVDVRSGSGIFKRCEECGRKLVKSMCTVHGRMKGEEDMAVRAVFDDGSGTCMLRGNRKIVEEILDRRMEEISREVMETMDPDMVTDELSRKMVGRTWTVSGDPIMDDYGLSVVISNLDQGWDPELMKDEISLILEVVQ